MAVVISISDPNDGRLSDYANLKGARVHSSSTGRFIVEGKWCVQRLVESRLPIESVLVECGHEQAAEQLVDAETKVYTLPRDRMRELVGYNFHRGMLGCGIRPPLRPLSELPVGDSTPTRAIATVGVNQRENVGGILRSAAALGFSHVLVGPDTVDPYSRRSVRVSMAAVLFQRLYAFDDPQHQLRALSRRGFRTVVTTLASDATPLEQLPRDDRPLVVVLGSEEKGVGPEIEKAATDRVTIPMAASIDSLNVAVAAAIVMYQLRGRLN